MVEYGRYVKFLWEAPWRVMEREGGRVIRFDAGDRLVAIARVEHEENGTS